MHFPRLPAGCCLSLCAQSPSSSSTRHSFLILKVSLRLLSTSPALQKERCCYEVLGVSRRATHDEIKKAFYEKSKKLHPDLHNASPASTVAFVELKTAYDTLRRPADRLVYDHRDEMEERARERARHRHAYRPSVRRPEYYGGGGDWQAFFRQNPNGRRPGGEENLSESEIFKRRNEQWKLIMKWTIIGFGAVVLYNTGYLIQLRLLEHKLSKLIESDEIAKSFLRQAEFNGRDKDAAEVGQIAALLTRDVDEAYRRKCEELRERRNPDEIREEYRWMRAVEDAGRYRQWRERKEQKREKHPVAARPAE